LNSIIEEIYVNRRVRDEAGNEYPLKDHISASEGEFITSIIAQDNSIHRTIEIGCAYGLSSLYICGALAGRAGAKHIIIDPNEYSGYKGVGVANLKRAGIDFFELIADGSEFALPSLAEKQANTFDLVFIDGWHTFDQTLLDLFYANRLIRVGGYIIVDDCTWVSVAKAVAYFSKYPAYQCWGQLPSARVSRKRRLARRLTSLLPEALGDYILPKIVHDLLYSVRYASMVALRKTAEDQRDWTWYKRF
jgi:predicted O-methyltransferase YrrM